VRFRQQNQMAGAAHYQKQMKFDERSAACDLICD